MVSVQNFGLVCLVPVHYRVVLVNVDILFFSLFQISNNNRHQNILTFFTFYITSIIFYYYSNKKIHYNTNSFYFISHHHFLLIPKLTTHYPVLFCSLPNKPFILVEFGKKKIEELTCVHMTLFF